MKTLTLRLIASLIMVAGFCSCHTTHHRNGTKTVSVSPVIEHVLVGAVAGAVGRVHAPPCGPQGQRPRMMPARPNYRQHQSRNTSMSRRPTYGGPTYGSYQPRPQPRPLPRPTHRRPSNGGSQDPYYNNYMRGYGGPTQGQGTNSDGSKRYPYPYYPYPRRTS